MRVLLSIVLFIDAVVPTGHRVSLSNNIIQSQAVCVPENIKCHVIYTLHVMLLPSCLERVNRSLATDDAREHQPPQLGLEGLEHLPHRRDVLRALGEDYIWDLQRARCVCSAQPRVLPGCITG